MKTISKIAISTGGGAAVGGGTYAAIGGMGLVLFGTVVGITIITMIAIGAGLGFGGSALYSLGKKNSTEKRVKEKTVGQLLKVVITGKGY